MSVSYSAVFNFSFIISVFSDIIEIRSTPEDLTDSIFHKFAYELVVFFHLD